MESFAAFMAQMRLAQQICSNSSAGLRHCVMNAFPSSEISVSHQGAYSFRIKLNAFYALSVSCPPDCVGMYETALCNTISDEFELIYKDDWEYSNVQRFSTTPQIIEEINRMFKVVNND
jgi:hypothetical protein